MTQSQKQSLRVQIVRLVDSECFSGIRQVGHHQSQTTVNIRMLKQGILKNN